MWKRSRHARRALALCLLTLSAGCKTLLGKRPASEPARVQVVCAPAALDPCLLSRWLVPSPLSADQAGELALSARTESAECATRHEELVQCVKAHNEKAE